MWCAPYAIQLKDASWAKSFTSKYYYKLMNKMADVPIVEGGSDFRLMNSKALGTLKRFREHGRFCTWYCRCLRV